MAPPPFMAAQGYFVDRSERMGEIEGRVVLGESCKIRGREAEREADGWRHRATVMCSYENSPADSWWLPSPKRPDTISGLEVNELNTTNDLASIMSSEFAGLGIECDATSLQGQHLRTTAPTTMRRWDQYFGRDSETGVTVAVSAGDFVGGAGFVPGTVGWRPEQSADLGIWATLANGTRVYGDKEWVDRMVAFYGKKAETEADKLDSLKTEVARAAWNRLFAEDFVTILQSACAGLRSRDVEPEPKRSPNAKPALPSLSIEAPLGNRYGGLGWCDEN